MKHIAVLFIFLPAFLWAITCDEAVVEGEEGDLSPAEFLLQKRILPVIEEGNRHLLVDALGHPLIKASLLPKNAGVEVQSPDGWYRFLLNQMGGEGAALFTGTPEVQIHRKQDGKLEARSQVGLSLKDLEASRERLEGIVRSAFRADGYIHPHLFPPLEGMTTKLSKPQEASIQALLAMQSYIVGLMNPMGMGKTLTAAQFVKRLSGRMIAEGKWKKPAKPLFVVNNNMILRSALRTFTRELDYHNIVEAFGRNAKPITASADGIFISRMGYINELQKIHDIMKADPDQPWVIIVDEAHHIGRYKGQFHTILSDLMSFMNDNHRVLLLSATLWHGDAALVRDVLHGEIYGAFLSEGELEDLRNGRRLEELSKRQTFRGMRYGYLCPCYGIDLIRPAKTSSGRSLLNHVERKKENEESRELTVYEHLLYDVVERIENNQIPNVPDRGAIVAPNQIYAGHYKNFLSKLLKGEVRELHSGLDTDGKPINIEDVLDWYQNEGDYDNDEERAKPKYLVVVDMLDEGVDLPIMNLLIVLKNYSSDPGGLRRLLQQFGRPDRPDRFKPDFRYWAYTDGAGRLIEDLSQVSVHRQTFPWIWQDDIQYRTPKGPRPQEEKSEAAEAAAETKEEPRELVSTEEKRLRPGPAIRVDDNWLPLEGQRIDRASLFPEEKAYLDEHPDYVPEDFQRTVLPLIRLTADRLRINFKRRHAAEELFEAIAGPKGNGILKGSLSSVNFASNDLDLAIRNHDRTAMVGIYKAMHRLADIAEKMDKDYQRGGLGTDDGYIRLVTVFNPVLGRLLKLYSDDLKKGDFKTRFPSYNPETFRNEAFPLLIEFAKREGIDPERDHSALQLFEALLKRRPDLAALSKVRESIDRAGLHVQDFQKAIRKEALALQRYYRALHGLAESTGKGATPPTWLSHLSTFGGMVALLSRFVPQEYVVSFEKLHPRFSIETFRSGGVQVLTWTAAELGIDRNDPAAMQLLADALSLSLESEAVRAELTASLNAIDLSDLTLNFREGPTQRTTRAAYLMVNALGCTAVKDQKVKSIFISETMASTYALIQVLRPDLAVKIKPLIDREQRGKFETRYPHYSHEDFKANFLPALRALVSKLHDAGLPIVGWRDKESAPQLFDYLASQLPEPYRGHYSDRLTAIKVRATDLNSSGTSENPNKRLFEAWDELTVAILDAGLDENIREIQNEAQILRVEALLVTYPEPTQGIAEVRSFTKTAFLQALAATAVAWGLWRSVGDVDAVVLFQTIANKFPNYYRDLIEEKIQQVGLQPTDIVKGNGNEAGERVYQLLLYVNELLAELDSASAVSENDLEHYKATERVLFGVDRLGGESNEDEFTVFMDRERGGITILESQMKKDEMQKGRTFKLSQPDLLKRSFLRTADKFPTHPKRDSLVALVRRMPWSTNDAVKLFEQGDHAAFLRVKQALTTLAEYLKETDPTFSYENVLLPATMTEIFSRSRY